MSFAYPKPLLEFLIKSPPNNPDFNVCLVHETSGLVGFICGKPTKMTVKSETLPMIQINFLCVHKNYRNQRIGPILISEITRRANIKGMFHAAYTVGVYVHKPLCAATYYHRMINRERAMQCGFALPFSQKFKHIEKKMETIKIQKDIKLVAVPKKKRIEAYNLMMQFFRQHFKVYPEITQECFSFMCKSPQGSCEVLCVLDATTNSPCIVLSFFTITTRIKSAMQDLKAAFLYYYAYKDEILFKKALLQLMYILKERNYDLLNCLDIMKNSSFIDDLRFLKGTGKLNYCLYNYNVNDIESKDVALVFL
ncbi:MAG: glycylpeptide N-tetradecanoyltransferase [Marteilia pararefringens]